MLAVLDNPRVAEATLLPDTLRIPCFFSQGNAALPDILERPYHLFLELGGYDRLAGSIARVLADAPHFALSLTTPTAYRGNIAELVAAHLNKRFGLQSYKSMHIHTCLQEALANAIVHGNLEIDGQFESVEKFDRHYALVDSRLEQEAYRGRRVVISAWDESDHLKLCVANEGCEFPQKSGKRDPRAASGRGLFLVESLASKLWIGNDRRSFFMTFDY